MVEAPVATAGRSTNGGAPVTAALSDSLISLITPIVNKCDTGIQEALDSQAELSQQIDRVASQLQAFLSVSQLPSFAPYAARIAEVRRRAIAAGTTLSQVQSRLNRIEEMADSLQREQGPTLPRVGPNEVEQS